jgi:hypothetical protein
MTSWAKFIIYGSFNIHDVSESPSAAQSLCTVTQLTMHSAQHNTDITPAVTSQVFE